MNETQAGLSMYHISPQTLGTEIRKPEPKIKYCRGANLIVCELGKTTNTKGKSHTWLRGRITHFSKGARRRILRLVASLKRSEVPVFCTLTYPDIFPKSPQVWKRDLDTFFKRLLRQFPRGIIIWRMERKERQTGLSKGEIAPHFHLLVYNVPYIYLLGWISAAWYQVVDSGDERHFRAGTRVEPVRSVRGVLYYTSKYICKQENDELEGIGRLWGIVGRYDHEGNSKLKAIQGEWEMIELDQTTALTVLRYMRRRASELYKKGRYIGRRKIPGWGVKFTLIGDTEFWYQAVPKIQAIL